MKKKAYIFDLDGTLIDSMAIGWKYALLGYLDNRGVAYPSDIIKRVIALGLPGVAKYYKENLAVAGSEEEIYASLVETMQEQYNSVIPAKANAAALLKKLKGEGASLNVLTAGTHRLFDPCLKRLGLTDYFENTWSTEEFIYTKTQPALYREVARLLGVAPEDCVMIDDSIAALRPAKEAGFATIGVYDEASKDSEAEMRGLADRYIYDLGELL